MRGESERQATMMMALTPEGFVPMDHPLRQIKPLADSALSRMSPLFDELHADNGRPSIPPEYLLKSSLLMAFYTIRSERQFCEQLRYNLLFKWFLDLNVEDEPFHPTTFTKNRARLVDADAARVLLKEVVREARRRRLLSTDHFTPAPGLNRGWTARCWRLGPRTRVTVRATSKGRLKAVGATAMPTPVQAGGRLSRASAAVARRTSRPPIPRRACNARASSKGRSSATSVMC